MRAALQILLALDPVQRMFGVGRNFSSSTPVIFFSASAYACACTYPRTST